MRRLAAMGAYRLSMYLKKEGISAYWAAYPRLLDSSVTRELLEEMEQNYFDSLYAEEGNLKTLLRLLEPDIEAGYLAWSALELAMLYAMNPHMGEVFAAVHPPSRDGATLTLAAKLLYGEGLQLEYFDILQDAFSRCELLLQADYPANRIGDTLLLADDRLIAWLKDGESLPQHPMLHMGDLPDAPTSPIWEEKRLQLLTEMEGGGRVAPGEVVIAAVSGESGSGRRFFVKQTAQTLGKRLLLADMSYFGSLDSLLRQWRGLLRELLLQPILLCITGIEKHPSWESEILILVREYEAVVKRAWKAGLQDAPGCRPLFLTVAEDV